MTIFRRLFFAC